MGQVDLFTLILSFVFTICFAHVNIEKQQDILDGFKHYLNNLPSQLYRYDDGAILNVQKLNDIGKYRVEIKIKATDLNNLLISKYIKCSAIINHNDNGKIKVENNQYNCEDIESQAQQDHGKTDYGYEYINNYIDSAVTNKQLKPISQQQSESPCVGCSVSVNPKSPGVNELVNLLLKDLDRHDPTTKHSLNTIISVKKQAQGTNAVRYILILNVNYNKCSTEISEHCVHLKTCKISMLKKSRIKYPDDSFYKSIALNNCTQHDILKYNRSLDTNNRGTELSPDNIHKTIIEKAKNPIYETLARASLEKYLRLNNITANYVVVTIGKSIIKIGTITRLYFRARDMTLNSQGKDIFCYSEILKEPWISDKDFKVKCNIENVLTKHDGDIVIGVPQFHDPHIRNLAEKSLKKYLQSVGNYQQYKVSKIEKVTTQLFSGLLTSIDFIASVTENGTSNSIRCHSSIWEQFGLIKQNIIVSCNVINTNRRYRRNIKRNSDNTRHKFLAQKAVDAFLIIKNIKQKYFVSKILNVTEVDVDGNLTKIHFKASPSNDKIANNLICFSEIWIHTKYINVICHFENVQKLSGGIVDRDPNDPEIKDLARESLNKYLKSHRITQQYSVSTIMKATSQVVAGDLIRIEFRASPIKKIVAKPLVCQSKIWVQSWLNKKDINITCRYISTKNMPGGIVDIDVHSNKVQQLANETLINFLKSHSITQTYFVSKILKATEQKVAGTIIRIEFRASPLKNMVAKPLLCQSKIWSQAWLHKKDINITCRYIDNRQVQTFDNKPVRVVLRSFVGGPTKRDPNDPKIKQLARESLKKYEKGNNVHGYRLKKVLKATSQVVSGTLIRIHFIAHTTKALGRDIRCHSKILEQVWLNNKKIKVWCRPAENTRTKRSILNGIINMDPNFKKTFLEPKFNFEKLPNTINSAIEKHIQFKDPNLKKQKTVNILTLPTIYQFTWDHQVADTAGSYHDIQIQYLFSDYIANYKPDYIDDRQEITKRFYIFKDNVKKINELNTREQGTARYAINKFADLTYEEFRNQFLGLNTNLHNDNQIPTRLADIPQIQLPDSYDWRHFNAVTVVKDQGSCGSCWAFSVTGNIEGQWKIHSGELISLSEQELVDCDVLDLGCNGGIPDNAYRAIQQMGGIEGELDYPYEGKEESCVSNKTLTKVQIKGAVHINTNENDMAKWLVKNGPITIGINSNAMQFYSSGVSHPGADICNPTELDHGVLLVGYGIEEHPVTHKSLPFWIVKNSWGASWGESGYYRVFRGDGTCGLNLMASSAVV